jgi:hypothetical protein
MYWRCGQLYAAMVLCANGQSIDAFGRFLSGQPCGWPEHSKRSLIQINAGLRQTTHAAGIAAQRAAIVTANVVFGSQAAGAAVPWSARAQIWLCCYGNGACSRQIRLIRRACADDPRNGGWRSCHHGYDCTATAFGRGVSVTRFLQSYWRLGSKCLAVAQVLFIGPFFALGRFAATRWPSTGVFLSCFHKSALGPPV